MPNKPTENKSCGTCRFWKKYGGIRNASTEIGIGVCQWSQPIPFAYSQFFNLSPTEDDEGSSCLCYDRRAE